MICRCGKDLEVIAATAAGAYAPDQAIRTTYTECTNCETIYETCQSTSFEYDRMRSVSFTYPYKGRLNRKELKQAPGYKGQITVYDEDKILTGDKK